MSYWRPSRISSTTTDVLYRALVKDNPAIWPFVELYLLRKPQKEYQTLVHDLHARLNMSSRMTEKVKVKMRAGLPRMPCLTQLARLRVHEAMDRKVCPASIASLGLPPILSKFVAFTAEIDH